MVIFLILIKIYIDVLMDCSESNKIIKWKMKLNRINWNWWAIAVNIWCVPDYKFIRQKTFCEYRRKFPKTMMELYWIWCIIPKSTDDKPKGQLISGWLHKFILKFTDLYQFQHTVFPRIVSALEYFPHFHVLRSKVTEHKAKFKKE